MGKGYLYLLTIVLLAVYSSAVGISYQYMENNTLDLYPGQEYHFKLVVQNKDPEPAMANITEESPLVEIIGDPILYIPAQNFDTYVVFNISIPHDARIGETHVIRYSVSPMEEGEGQVPLSVRYSRDFNVRIVDAPDADFSPEVQLPVRTKTIKDMIYIPIILLVLLTTLIGGLVWRKSSQFGKRVVPENHPQEHSTAQPETAPAAPSVEVIHNEMAPVQTMLQKVETVIVHHMPQFTKEATPKQAEIKNEPQAAPAVTAPKEEAPKPNKWNFATKEEPTKPKIMLKGIVLTDTSKFFYTKNGTALKSLEELKNALSSMDEETFSYHVNNSKNDFANWTLYCLDEPEIASAMLKSTTRMEMLKAAQNEA
jgi:hypothetical protein